MATVSSLGAGSGLDLSGLLTNLMKAEQVPLTALQTREASYQSKISALGSLQGALSTLQTAASALTPTVAATYSASLSDSSIATALTTKDSAVGKYTLEVTQLAQKHRIATSTTASPFTGGVLTTGGTLTIALDTKTGSALGKTTNVTLADGSTPEQVRDAINGASAGITASVTGSGADKQLVLVGDTEGNNQFIKLSGVAALAYDPNATPAPATDSFAQEQAAQDSAFKINGTATTSHTNTTTTSSALGGLTLSLLAITPVGTPATVTVSKDSVSDAKYRQALSDQLISYSASVADTTIATASASAGAVSGSYSLEVSSLAQNQRLVSKSSAGYTDASSVIGTGDLKIEFGSLKAGVYTAESSRTKSITIDSTNATLGGLRDAINAANIGASATIVVGSAGAQLILTSATTGLSNVMKLSGTASGTSGKALAGFDYDPALDSGTMTQAALDGGQAATNAAFKLNGIAATSSTNSVSGVLDGVTLNLSKVTTTPTTLTVIKSSTATSSLTTSLNAFIKAYNDANTTMTGLGAYDAKTKVAGALQGNTTLRSARSAIQSLVFGTSGGGTSPYQRLSDLGVSIAKNGSLSLDSTKLTKAIAADQTTVANLISTVGSAFKSGIEALVGTTGSIASATDGANRTIKDLTKRQEALSLRLVTIEAQYRKQFTALDTLIAGMKQTSTYLTQQLASLPGSTSSK